MSTPFVINRETLDILSNFAHIQDSVLLQPGTKQTTTTTGKSLFALANLSEEWPVETGIYDLGTFLQTLSLFQSPSIKFENNVMTISGNGTSKVKYRMSDPSTILVPPADEPGNKLNTDNHGVSIVLSNTAMVQLRKAISVLGLGPSTDGHLLVSVVNGEVVFRAIDEKDSTAHSYEYVVPSSDTAFLIDGFEKEIMFKTEYIDKLMNGGYTLSLSDRKYGHFKHEIAPIEYFMVGSAQKKK